MHITEEKPFLDAVFDRYADDRPRLVYADFLDDSGEPERAELIRVQLALARLGEDDPRRPPLSDRQAELLTANRARWTAHLAGLVECIDFRRGVPDSASVDAATFLDRGEELFERLRVRRLRLRDVSPVMPKVVLSPLLAHVRELDLCNGDLGNGGLNLLVRSPFLQNLDSLDLGFNGLDDAGVEILARSSHFPNLRSLSLNDNDTITSEGLKSLADSPFFAGLTALDVSGNDISDAGVLSVVDSKSLTRLRAFHISGNQIGDTGIAALAGSPLFARIVKDDSHLEIRSNVFGPAGAEALAACPALAGCVSLDLSNNYLGVPGIARLLRSTFLGRLKTLRLGRNQFTDAGVLASRQQFDRLLDHLQILDLSGNRLTRVGMGLLTQICGDRPVRLEMHDNVQSATAGDAPVAVAGLVTDVLDGVAQNARLKRRVTNPRHLNEDD